MNLDELKNQWMAQNEKLDKTLRWHEALLRETATSKARSALRGWSRTIWIELVINFVAVIWLGNFIADHLGEPRFLIPALTLDLCATGWLIVAGRQLAALTRIDFDAPILVSQKMLENLRIDRTRANKWILLLAPLLWTPLFIVACRAFLGVDVYRSFTSAWLLMNLLGGVGLIPLALWASRRFAGRLAHYPFFQRCLDDMGGRNLAEAKASLDRLASFAAEVDEP